METSSTVTNAINAVVAYGLSSGWPVLGGIFGDIILFTANISNLLACLYTLTVSPVRKCLYLRNIAQMEAAKQAERMAKSLPGDRKLSLPVSRRD